MAKKKSTIDPKKIEKLKESFAQMMARLHEEEAGAGLRVDIIQEPEVESFIDTHAQILDSSFSEVPMSESMRRALEESDRIFSGFKTFHELNEAFPSLIGEDGKKKLFNRFLNDVKKIDQTYNERYLRAEYNFATAAGQMASKWEGYAKDGNEYYLQYRTANDGQVRPEHAALHRVTLPAEDSFWDIYFPPNGWNCRCTVIQVLKDEAKPTPHEEAIRRGNQALAKDKKGMFRFNPGKEKKIFPDYNPYTISKCSTCPRKDNLNLAKQLAGSQLCEVCSKTRYRGNDTIDIALKQLHELKGKDYVSKLREITEMKVFKEYKGKKGIFYVGATGSEDFRNQLNAAEKAVRLGYKAYILPNPKKTRSGDLIFVRKNYYSLYDLKTISGNNSVGNRLKESVGQARNVLLNMNTSYNPRKMATEIERYFQQNNEAENVLIFKGKREIEVNSVSVNKNFHKIFLKIWDKRK